MEKHRMQADRCFLILAAVEKANSEQDRKYTRNDIKLSKSMGKSSIYTRYVIKRYKGIDKSRIIPYML